MSHRFLLDGMLGSLARWLRILGYDTVYYNDMQDDELRREAKASDRILITRDLELSNKAKKEGVETVLISSEQVTDQLKELVQSLGLSLVPLNTRCPRCNGDLNPIEKELVEGKVPTESYRVFDDFWVCSVCDAIYWKGSHWTQIKETLENIAVSKSL